jgi:hypothetical protein
MRNHGVSSSGFLRITGIAACALLLAACHGGLDTGTSPSVTAADSVSGDDPTGGDGVASAYAAPVSYEMVEVGGSGTSGTCTLAGARSGFRLKAQGQGVPGTIIHFHLVMPNGFRTTAATDVSNQGTFRTGQDLITSFPAGVEAKCVVLDLDGGLLAESVSFPTPM